MAAAPVAPISLPVRSVCDGVGCMVSVFVDNILNIVIINTSSSHHIPPTPSDVSVLLCVSALAMAAALSSPISLSVCSV